MADNIQIAGGAGPEETAAIAAVVAGIAAEEKAALAVRKQAIVQSQWIESGRPLHHTAPLTPDEYSKRPGQALVADATDWDD